MADRSIIVRLRADVADFKRKMDEAAKSTGEISDKARLSELEDQLKAAEQGAEHLRNTMGLMGAGLTAVAGLAVKSFMDFDQAMSNVAATGEDARNSIDGLREAAIVAGAETAFSATEAANAIEELAKAGLSTSDILGGALDGTLALAASDNLELADAASYAATAMQQFNLAGSDASHVADLLAAGAGKAMGGVADMGAALNQGGLIASQMGLSIEETTGALAAMAQQGLLGSDAGTSLKTALIALSNPSTQAANAMEQFGIAAYDANGEFVGMTSLAGQLETAFKGQTDATRNAALATIFGTDALRTANVLYSEGAAGIADWISQVDDQGYAAETAATKMDNLRGDIEEFTGALETAMIGAGSGADGPLRLLTQQATDLVSAFTRLPDPVQQGILLIAGGAGLGLLGVAAMGKLRGAVGDAVKAVVDLGIMSDETAKKTVGIGKNVGKWAVGITAAVSALEALNSVTDRAALGTNEVDSKIKGLASSGDVVKDLFGDMLPKDSDLTRGRDFASFLDTMANPSAWDTIGGHASDLGVSITRVFGDASVKSSELRDRMLQYGDSLGQLAQTDMPAAVEAFQAIGDAAGNYRGVNEDLLSVMPGFRDALIGVADAAGLATDDATLLQIATGQIKPVMDDAADGAQNAADAYLAAAQAAEEQYDAQQKLYQGTLSAREAQRSYKDAVDAANESLQKNGKTLNLNTEEGRANQDALDNIASSGLDLVDSLRETGASTETLQNKMQGARDSFVRTAESMGMPTKKAEALADELGLIPGTYTAKVDVNTGNASAEIDAVRRQIINLPNSKTITIKTNTQVVQNAGPGNRTGGQTFDSGGFTGPGGKYEPAGIVHRGEWVINQDSSRSIERAAPGLLGALNAQGAGALGLGGYAGGGAVGSAQRSLASAERTAAAMARRVRNQRASVKAAEKADRKADTAASAKRVREAEKKLDRLEKELDKRRDRVEAQRDRLSRLRDEKRETSTDLSRGNIREQLTGGMDSAYSVVDQMKDLAGSGDLTSSQSRRLRNAATSGAANLQGLYRDAAKVAKELEKAKAKAEQLSQIKAQVGSVLAGGFSLADAAQAMQKQHTNAAGEVWYTQQKPTGKSMLAAARAYADRVRTLAKKLKELEKKGFAGTVLQEVASMGVDGGIPAADALLQLSKADVKDMNQQYSRIQGWSNRAGQTVTEGFYEGGAQAAAGLVQGLRDNQDDIEAEITKVAKGMETALKKALGIKSPSRVFRGLMSYVGQGAVLGLQDVEPDVSRAASNLLDIPSQLPAASYQVPAGNVNPTALAATTQVQVTPMSPQDIQALGDYIIRASQNTAARVVASTGAAQDATARYQR
ncbi:phage tail tape measure protein [Isoptericola sp. QY 916]|uniref:phage tail tape measure protein n=1 Tax=Isoptericola sp. QY 916 TaxID=2782570 RepID=UPI003D2FB333|nr:phage tail tape measure protein [Isoptericola sp. QY 916]